MSELALKRIKEAKDKRLTRLDLGNCGLKSFPPEVFELIDLEELILTNKDYYEGAGNVNSFYSIPLEIVNLKNLKFLDISGGWYWEEYDRGTPDRTEQNYQIKDLTPITFLNNLESLNIFFNL